MWLHTMFNGAKNARTDATLTQVFHASIILRYNVEVRDRRASRSLRYLFSLSKKNASALRHHRNELQQKRYRLNWWRVDHDTPGHIQVAGLRRCKINEAYILHTAHVSYHGSTLHLQRPAVVSNHMKQLQLMLKIGCDPLSLVVTFVVTPHAAGVDAACIASESRTGQSFNGGFSNLFSVDPAVGSQCLLTVFAFQIPIVSTTS